MYGTTLISGIRKDYRDGPQHIQIYITDNQTYAGKSSLFKPYKERTPALTFLFYTLNSTKDFTADILAVTDDSNQNKNILDLTDPAAF